MVGWSMTSNPLAPENNQQVFTQGSEVSEMSDKQPNIVMFWWDNFGWGELGCYGGGGAPRSADAVYLTSSPAKGCNC